MPSTAGSVMLQAANHLNDPSQLVFTPAKLLPFFNMAIQELGEELGIYNLSPMKATSIVIEVDAGDTELDEMPADFLEVVEVMERPAGSSQDYYPVKERNWIDPNITTDQAIIMWATRGLSIEINPPATARDVLINYFKTLTEAAGSGTAIDIELTRRFLALLTARNAARDLGNSPSKAASYEADIARSRDRVVRNLSKPDQAHGVRRLPYRGRS